VSLAQAALGTTVDVVTIDGVVEVKVPPGTQPEATLVLRGRGVRRLQSPRRGDQFVHVKLVVPRALDDAAKALYEQLRELEADGAPPGGGPKQQAAKSKLDRYNDVKQAAKTKAADSNGGGEKKKKKKAS
jgi:DnaJ-class molecular chaperone